MQPIEPGARRPLLDWAVVPLRSLLFAPGNHSRRLEKVGTFGSDAIVLDLEDAVAESEKTEARSILRRALPSYREVPVVVVRVNSLASGRLEDDLRATVCSDIDCVMIPKVDDATTLPVVDAILSKFEAIAGLENGSVRILAVIETPKGVARVAEIGLTAPGRVVTFVFGLGDFSTEMAIDLTEEGTELLYARSAVTIAARASGMRAAIDGPYLDLHNLDGLVRDTLRCKQLGFQGRVVIHPSHVEPVKKAFSEIQPAELDRLRRVVDEFASAERKGLASIQVDGKFVDYTIYKQAQERIRVHQSVANS